MASGDAESFEILSLEDGSKTTPPPVSLPSPSSQPAAAISSQGDVRWGHGSNVNVLLSSSSEHSISSITKSFDDISVSGHTSTRAQHAGTLASMGRSQSVSDISSQQSKGTSFTQKSSRHGPRSDSKESWKHAEEDEEEFSFMQDFPQQQTTQGAAQGSGLQRAGYPTEPPQAFSRSRSTVPEGDQWTQRDVRRPLYTPQPERPSQYTHQQYPGQQLPPGPGDYSYMPQQVPHVRSPQQQGPMYRQPPPPTLAPNQQGPMYRQHPASTPAPNQQGPMYRQPPPSTPYQEQNPMQTYLMHSSPMSPGCYSNTPPAPSFGTSQPYIHVGQQRQDYQHQYYQHQYYQQEWAGTNTPQAPQSVAEVCTGPVLQSPSGASVVSQDPKQGTRAAAQRLTVKVTGVNETTDLNNLEMFFENKKRSGGDTITDTQDHRSEGFVLFTYECPEVAERVLSKSHSFDSVALTVTPYQPPATVKVSDLQPSISEDLLLMYFETEKSGADSDVDKIHLDHNKGEALITFSDPEAVQRVLKGKHIIQGKEVQVTLPTDSTIPRTPIPVKTLAATPRFTPAPKVTHAVTTAPTTPSTSGCRASGSSSVSTRDVGSTTFTTTTKLSTSPAADEVEVTEPSSSTVEVRGVHKNTSKETLKLYFENKRRSGGGPVTDVDSDSATDVTRITFEDAKDAANVVARKHVLDQATLTVRLYHPPEMMKNAILLTGLPEIESNEKLLDFVEAKTQAVVEKIWFGEEEEIALVIFKGSTVDFAKVQRLSQHQIKGHDLRVSQVPCTFSVLVSDLPQNPPLTEESVGHYFENTTRSGGGEVSAVVLEDASSWAKVTFTESKVAATVAERSHTYQHHSLKVRLFFECLGPSGGSEEPALRIPDPVAVEDGEIGKLTRLQEVPAFREELESVLKQCHAVLNTSVTSGRLALVCCLTPHMDGARQIAKTWSRDTQAAVQNYLHTLNIKEESVATEVFSEIKSKLGGLATNSATGFHYDNVQGKLFIIWKSPQGRHIYNDIENVLCDARDKVHRIQNGKIEQIHASKGKLELLKKDKGYMDILKRFPKLIVRVDEIKEGLQLQGLQEEIQPVRQVIDTVLNGYTTCSYTWPLELQSALQKLAEGKRVIREACMEKDSSGFVEVHSSRLDVCSGDRKKADDMLTAGVKTFQRFVIRLDDSKDGACKLPEWQELIIDVQKRNNDRILITKDQSSVTICGVGSGIERDHILIKQFLEEHSKAEYLCKMDKPEYELLQLYLQDHRVSESSPTVEMEFREDTSQMVIKGSKKDVEDFKKIIGRFQPKLIREQREFSEPCMREFLESLEWTRMHRSDVERRLNCKILGPTAVEGAVGGVSFGSSSIQHDEDLDDTSPSQPDPVDTAQVTRQPRCNMPVRPRIFLNAMSDITKEEHEVLINSTNSSLQLDQGQVSGALLKVGGQTIQEECRTNYPRGIKVGDIAVTGPGILKGKRRLMCKKLFHCCLPDTKDTEVMKTVVTNAVRKCLAQAEERGLKSVGFPALGTGTLKYPPDIVARTMYETVVEYGRQNPGTLISDVIFILHKKPEDAVIRQAFKDEDEKHKILLRHSSQTVEEVQGPTIKKTKAYKHFAKTTGRVSVTILAYRQDAVGQAVQEILQCYTDKICQMLVDVPELNDWNDNFLNALERACAAVNVDVTFNFTLSRILLRGFRHNVDRIPMHATLTDAQQDVHRKQNEEAMARQVQWSTVEISLGGEKLVPYELENNYLLETGYRDGKRSVVIGHMIDGVKIGYNVNFITLKEVPENPAEAAIATPLRVIRQDKIQEMSADLPLPKNWSGNDLDLVWIPEDSLEFSQVSESFTRSLGMPAKVIKVGQVQNATLYRQYMAKKQEMEKTMVSDRLCERDQLWHGTNQAAVDGIIKHGFNRSYCREVPDDAGDVAENALGQGVYFASEATYSSRDQYARANASGERNMFRCKVLVGEYTEGTGGIRFPPDMPSTGPKRRYDSVVDDPTKPTIFVVFSDVQAYPEYLIVFKDS